MNKKILKRFEIAGVFFVYLFASFLHFIYDWTNGSIVSIIFGAVNESVWEHMKIFMAAYILWGIIEVLCVHPPFKQFVAAKVIGLTFLMLAIPLGFYIYTFFTKEPVLFIDIALSVVWVIISLYISYRLTVSEKSLKPYYHISLLVLLLYVAMFFSFTVFPPKFEIFRDVQTGMYGIIPDYIDTGAISLDVMYSKV